jgi:hypothetical protein
MSLLETLDESPHSTFSAPRAPTSPPPSYIAARGPSLADDRRLLEQLQLDFYAMFSPPNYTSPIPIQVATRLEDIPGPSPAYTPIPRHNKSTVDVAHDFLLIPHEVAHYAPLYPGDRLQTAREARTEAEIRKKADETITSLEKKIKNLEYEQEKHLGVKASLRELIRAFEDRLKLSGNVTETLRRTLKL